jgi:opacity protein-like surface antigen
MKKLLLTAVVAVLSLSAALAAESYTVTATGNVDGKGKSVKATITIDRFSTQTEKDAARAAFDAGGTTGLAAKLKTVPAVGRLTFEDGRVFDLKLTNQFEVMGGRFVTVITAKPIVFLGADQPGAKAIDGFAVSVIDLSLKANGTAEGTAAPAAKVKIGDKGGFQVEDYGSRTIWLKDIKKL